MIYLDNAATTKPFNVAIEKATEFIYDNFHNPSALYQPAINNSKQLKTTKDKLLNFLGADNSFFDVIFTSCGSESDNMAVFCAKKRGVFVTSKGEHSAIHKSFLELKQRGFTVEFIDLNKDGSVNTEKLFDYLANNKVDFISIVHVNNETGAINQVNDIAKKVKSINKDIIFHVDGVQAFGKLDYKLSKDVDLYSISAHKVNALKGVGALIKRKSLNLSPFIYGGGQNNDLRSGTENVFGIKVFEFASEIHYSNLNDNFNKVKELNNLAKEMLNKDIFTIISSDNASPYILSLSAKGLRGEVILHYLEDEGILIGTGSACSSKNRYSRVIEACGYKKDYLEGVIRLSFSVENTKEEIIKAINTLNVVGQKFKGIMR